MGYTTDFFNQFKINKLLDNNTYDLLKGLNQTRRVKRKVAKRYGVEGEFYVEGESPINNNNIIDSNSPPSTQPSLYCQWMPTKDKLHIKWDGGEKFYNYIEWIEYIIKKILEPRGYILNGEVHWCGEDLMDTGVIKIVNNITSPTDLFEYKYIVDNILKEKSLLPTLLGIDKSLDKLINIALKEGENVWKNVC